MNLFTVLVLFPEYCSEDFPTDVHIETVSASNAFEATRSNAPPFLLPTVR